MIPPGKSRLAKRRADTFEALENRELLSAAHSLISHGYDFSRFIPHVASSIQYGQAPGAVQTGLTTLATNESTAAPTTTSTITLGNHNGTETYTTTVTGTGTSSQITVDQNGNPVTAPTVTNTTFGAITNTAVTTEITAIATALNLTAPDASASVTVITPASGPVVYVISLSPAASSSTHHRFTPSTTVSVDDAGDPVGNQTLPLSVFSSAIQTGLTAAAPAGATALSPTSLVTVRTLDGQTTYSATFHATGIVTTVTVNAAGSLTNLPSTSVVTFSTLDSTVQTALQTLAADEGFTGTIDGTQNVTAYDEGNGTIVYSVRVSITVTTDSGATYTYSLTVSVDQNGNPTVPPTPGASFGPFGGPFGGFLAAFFGGGFAGC